MKTTTLICALVIATLISLPSVASAPVFYFHFPGVDAATSWEDGPLAPDKAAMNMTVQPGTRSSPLQGWDCNYDVRFAYPEADPTCPFPVVGQSGVRSIQDGGDVLNQSMIDDGALPVPTAWYSYMRTAADGSTPDPRKGFLVEARAAVWGGSKSQIAVYNTFAAESLDMEFGACGIGVLFPCGTWPAHWIRMTTGFYEGGTQNDDKTVAVSAGLHTVRAVVAASSTPSETGGWATGYYRVMVRFSIDGVLVHQGRADVSPPSYGVRTQYLIGNLTAASIAWDYWAYKLSYQDPNALPPYPLPHVNPKPYPLGLRDGAITPYWSFIYDWADRDSATPAAFYLPYSTTETGTVQARSDVLYLTKSADSTTTLYVNDTLGTASTADDVSMYSSAAALVYLDLLHDATVSHAGSARGENITVEDGASPNFRVDRSSEIQISRSFNWSWDGGTNTYDFTLLLTNPTTRTWWNVWFDVPFIPGTAADPNSVTVFDQANNQYLTSGLNFLVTGGSVEFEVANLGAGLSRTWDLKYSPVARAEFSVIRLDLTQAHPDNTFAGAAYKGTVTTTLSASQSFSGDVMIVFNVADPSFASQIVDLTSLTIVNARTGTRVANWFPHPTQANIVVLPDQDIPAGAVQSYDVYFAYRSASAGGVGDFLGSELGAIVVVILVMLVLIFGIDNARIRRRRNRT